METALLFHKNGGKPGGKSEKFIPERIVHTISVVVLGLKTRMNAVLFPPFPHPGGCGVKKLRVQPVCRERKCSFNAFRVDFLECGGLSW